MVSAYAEKTRPPMTAMELPSRSTRCRCRLHEHSDVSRRTAYLTQMPLAPAFLSFPSIRLTMESFVRLSGRTPRCSPLFVALRYAAAWASSSSSGVMNPALDFHSRKPPEISGCTGQQHCAAMGTSNKPPQIPMRTLPTEPLMRQTGYFDVTGVDIRMQLCTISISVGKPAVFHKGTGQSHVPQATFGSHYLERKSCVSVSLQLKRTSRSSPTAQTPVAHSHQNTNKGLLVNAGLLGGALLL